MSGGDWEGLERALAASELAGIEVVRRRPSAYRTSFPVEELEVERAGPGRGTIVCKRPNWEELDATARLAKPRFLHESGREACVYEQLLPRGPAGPPRFLGAATDEGRNWLFIERIGGRSLVEIGEREIWEEAARWLARFHSAFAGQELGGCLLVERDADFHRSWLARARGFAADAGRRATLEWLAPRHEATVEALAAMPPTLLHGEFYAGNVLIDDRGAGVRVAAVDWELAGPGPGPLDLAALVSGWPAADRAAMREAYADARGAAAPSPRELDLARLQVAIQWLGWAPPEWEPPPGQRHDWAAEAVEIAEELEL